MSTYLLSIGINDYTDRAFTALTCCENDATEIHSLFKRNLELGERARKLVGRVTMAEVKNELRRIGQEVRNGDTFVFFFAGHGYQHPKREDQFLLFPEAEARLVNKGYLDGMLSLSALCELTDHWAGVARVFVLDACRSWLPGERSAQGEAFDNESALAYIASRDPRSHAPTRPASGKPTEQQSNVQALPPLILNATKNGEIAQELERQGRGVLALALERTLEAQSRAGEVVWLGQKNLSEIGEEMQRLLREDGSGASQTPFMVPSTGKVLLYKPRVGKEENKLSETGDQDELDWAIAKAKASIEVLETYIRRRPPGKHQDEALMMIAKLSAPPDARQEGEIKHELKPVSNFIKNAEATVTVKELYRAVEEVSVSQATQETLMVLGAETISAHNDPADWTFPDRAPKPVLQGEISSEEIENIKLTDFLRRESAFFEGWSQLDTPLEAIPAGVAFVVTMFVFWDKAGFISLFVTSLFIWSFFLCGGLFVTSYALRSSVSRRLAHAKTIGVAKAEFPGKLNQWDLIDYQNYQRCLVSDVRNDYNVKLILREAYLPTLTDLDQAIASEVTRRKRWYLAYGIWAAIYCAFIVGSGLHPNF